MHWLQGTFASRFNHFRREHGHLFHGRFKAILVEVGPSLARLVNYIHLNPVVAGVVKPAAAYVSMEQLKVLLVAGKRPSWLTCEKWLRELHLRDTPSDWLKYRNYLEQLSQDKQEQERQGFKTLDVGWAVGTEGWKKALAKDCSHLSLAQVADAAENAEFRRLQWAQVLDELLKQWGRTSAARRRRRKKGPPLEDWNSGYLTPVDNRDQCLDRRRAQHGRGQFSQAVPQQFQRGMHKLEIPRQSQKYSLLAAWHLQESLLNREE